MSKITYTDKVALNINQDIADVNKCNATDLNEIKSSVNELYDNINVMTASLSSDIVGQTTTQYVDIQLSEYSKVGSKLSISQGAYDTIGIKVTNGVSKVIVGANARISNTSANNITYNLFLYKTTIGGTRTNPMVSRLTINSGESATINISPILEECEDGDVFSLRLYKSSSSATTTILSTTNSTNLTLQVIE